MRETELRSLEQPNLFAEASEEEELSGIQEVHMPDAKIRKAMKQSTRKEIFQSLDVEVRPTDRFSEQNKLNDLSGRIWIQETKSVWHQKGLGKGHSHTYYERLHPAPFSYQDIGRLIRFFTKKGEHVLDPFCGVGSTLKACAVLDRRGIGVELSQKWSRLTEERLAIEIDNSHHQKIICSDIRDALDEFEDDYFQFMVTSPPYWSILTKKADHKVKGERLSEGLETQYSLDERDLGNIQVYEEFLEELTSIFRRIAIKVEDKRYMAIIVSDFRHGSKFYPFHSDLYQRLCDENIHLVGITILEQNHKKLYPYGYPFCYIPNIHHQYILIFRIHK